MNVISRMITSFLLAFVGGMIIGYTTGPVVGMIGSLVLSLVYGFLVVPRIVNYFCGELDFNKENE